MHELQPKPIDPLYEAVAALHEMQNEAADKTNASGGSASDMLQTTVYSLAICRVMIRLKSVMPEDALNALHQRLHRELPLRMLSF